MANINVEDKIEMRPIHTIRPYVRNPRNNSKTVELLTKLIPKVGFNVPIVVDEKGVIVKGHARFIAAIRLGMKEVPCITSHASPEAIMADRIADNRISEFSEWITNDLIDEINDMEFDLSDLGLTKINWDEVEDGESLVGEFKREADAEIEASHDTAVEEDYASEIERIVAEPHYSVTCEKCGYHMIIPLSEVEGEDEI